MTDVASPPDNRNTYATWVHVGVGYRLVWWRVGQIVEVRLMRTRDEGVIAVVAAARTAVPAEVVALAMPMVADLIETDRRDQTSRRQWEGGVA